MKKILSAIVILSLVFSPVTPAFAASDTWSATSVSAGWLTDANWGTAAPGATVGTTNTDTATFSNAGNGNTGILIDPTRNIGSITFDTAAAAAYIIGTGVNQLFLTSGGTIQTTSTVANIETVNAPLELYGAGGTYTFSSNAAAAANVLNFGGGITGGEVGATVLTLTGTNTGSNTISGIIGNGTATTVAVTKSGAGTWILSGVNTYTGTTTISAGTLALSHTQAIQSSSGIVFANTAGAQLTLNTSVITNGIISGGGTSGGNIDLQNFTLSSGFGAANATYAGVISGTGGFEYIGLGTLTLSGENTYTGTTNTIGTLKLGAAGVISDSSAVTNNGTFDLNGFNETIGSISSAGTLTNSSGTAATLTTGGDGTSTTYSGFVDGNLSLIKTGAGVFTLSSASGINVYTGTTTVSAGTLKLGASEVITDTSAVTVSGGATFDLNSFSETVGSLAGSGTVTSSAAGAVILTAGGNDTSTTFSGIVQNGSGTAALTKTGDGILTLSGANTYTGVTTLSAGTVNLGVAEIAGTSGPLGNSVAANPGSIVLSGGTLQYSAANQNDYSGRFSTAASQQYEVDTNSQNVTWATALTSSGGSLTKIGGGGTLTLNGANTYTGSTYIGSGTVKLGNATALDSTSDTWVSLGAVLDLNGQNGMGASGGITINGTGISDGGALINSSASAAGLGVTGQVTLASASTISSTGAGGLSLYGGVDNGGFDLTVTGDNATEISDITGGGGLNKLGAGTLKLYGTNDYDGLTNIVVGMIQLAGGGLGSSALGTRVTTGAALDLNGNTVFDEAVRIYGTGVSGSGALFNSSAAAASLAGVITLFDTGTITSSGAGGLTLLGGIDNAGYDLTFAGANATTVATNGISGDGGLIKTGNGTLNLIVANDYNGTTTVSNGTLALSGAATNNNIADSTTINVETGAGLNVTGLLGGATGLTLTSGQTLMGEGTVTGNLIIGTGSILSPGSSPGTISTVGEVTYAGGGTYTWEINDATGTAGTDPGWDLQDITGGLTISSTAGSPFTIDITSLTSPGNVSGNAANFNKYTSYAWTLVSTTTGISGFDASDFTLDSTNFTNSIAGTASNGIFGIAVGGNDLQLTYTAAVNTPPNPIHWMGGTDTAWNTHTGGGVTNWVDGSGVEANAVPNATSDVHFYYAGAGNLATTLGENFTIDTLAMDAGTGAVSISGNTLTLNGSDAITMGATAGALTINSAVTLGSAQTWLNNSTNDLTVAGNVTNGGFTLTINGAGDTGISGAISGTGGLTKTGAGTLTLSGISANTCSGLTAVSAGELDMNKTDGIDAIAGNLTVSGGTAKLLASNQIANTSTVTVSGTGILDMGAFNDTVSVFNMSAGSLNGTGTLTATTYGLSGGTVTANLGTGTMNVTGPTALDGTSAATAANISAGTLTLGASNRLADGATVTVSGTGILNMGVLNDTVSVFNMSAGSLNGTGTLTATTYGLSGGTVTANLGTGTMNVTGSTALNGTSAATAANISAGTLTLGASDRLANGATVTVSGTGILDMGAFNDTVAGVQITGGSINGSGGSLTSTTAFDMQAGTVSAILAGGVGLNKTTGGTVTLDGANAYTGTTTVALGTLNLNQSLTTSLLGFSGAGTVNLAGGMNISGAVTTSSDGNGTLNFLGSSTVGGAIGVAGAGDLATVSISGLVQSAYAISATAINIANNGTLRLSGDITTTGTLATALAAPNAVLDLQGYTLTHTGDMNLRATSDLNFDITTASTFGQATVSGTLTLPATVDITVNVVGSNYIAGGTQFLVIDGSAGAGVAGGNTVTDNSFLLSFTAMTDAFSQDLILNAVRSQTLGTLSGANSNTNAVGAALEGARAGATGDMLNVLMTLDAMTSAAPIIASLETMTPDVSSGAMQGSRSLNSHFLTAIQNRLAYARNGFAASPTGLATGDGIQGMGFWMQGLGGHESQGTREGIQGYSANTFGTTIGFDKLMNDHFRMGLAGGYGFGAINSKTPGSPSDNINSFQGTVYGSYDSVNLCQARKDRKYSRSAVRNQAERLWYVDGMLSFTQNNYDSRREIFVGPAERVAKAEHYGQQYSTQFETGYTLLFEKTRDLEVTPFVSLGYNYLFMNRYKENGADALNLNVAGKGFNQLEQGLGLKFAYPMASDKGTYIPSIKGAWLFDYLTDKFQTSASFAGGGPSFSTIGANPARNAFLLGAELAFLNKGNMTLTGNFDWMLRDQYQSYTYYLTLRFDF